LIDWPPRSGEKMEIPEIDRGDWFSLESARGKIRAEQERFLDLLVLAIESGSTT